MIFGDRKVIFYQVCVSTYRCLCSLSILHLLCMVPLFIPPTQAVTHVHRDPDTDVHTSFQRDILVNTALKQRQSRLTVVVVSMRVFSAPWSNLTHSENLQCRLSSFRGLMARQDVGCIIYDEANRQQMIGTKQTREQPLVLEQSNQKQSLSSQWRLVTLTYILT